MEPLGNDAAEAVQEGLAALQAGRVNHAIDRLRAALEFDPQSVDAHHYLGIAYARQNDTVRAIQHLEAAIRCGGQTSQIHYNLALLYEARGRAAEAARHFEAALHADPNYAPAREALERLRGAAASQAGAFDPTAGFPQHPGAPGPRTQAPPGAVPPVTQRPGFRRRRPEGGSGTATASLALAIVALLFMCAMPLSALCAVGAIALGVAHRSRSRQGSGVATAGIALGALILFFALLAIGSQSRHRRQQVRRPTTYPRTYTQLQATRTATAPTALFRPVAAGLAPYRNTRAPELRLVDAQGKTHALSNYRGKVVVLDFWAPG